METTVADRPRTGLRFVREALAEKPVIVESEEKSDGSAWFAGYLLRWGDQANIRDFFGQYSESFERGAFTKTFNERGPQGNNAIKLLRMHDRTNVQAGKFLDLHEDDAGPAFEARTIDTDTGRNLAVEIREGVMNTMSVGFDDLSPKENYDKERNHFTVSQAKMYEASPVYWPAYESASIEQFRSLDQIIPAFHRFMVILEAGGTISEDQTRQLDTMRARIDQLLGASGASQREEQENIIEATVSDHANDDMLARLRTLEAHYELNFGRRP